MRIKRTDARAQLQATEERLASWHRRLTRAANMVRSLERTRKRLQQFIAKEFAELAEPVTLHHGATELPSDVKVSGYTDAQPAIATIHSDDPDLVEKVGAALARSRAAKNEDDGSIPAFLARAKPGALTEADQKAIEEIKAGRAETQKVKSKASKAKSIAKRRGELRRMPLTGKDALKAIHGE